MSLKLVERLREVIERLGDIANGRSDLARAATAYLRSRYHGCLPVGLTSKRIAPSRAEKPSSARQSNCLATCLARSRGLNHCVSLVIENGPCSTTLPLG